MRLPREGSGTIPKGEGKWEKGRQGGMRCWFEERQPTRDTTLTEDGAALPDVLSRSSARMSRK